MRQVLALLAGLSLYPALALAVITPGFIRCWLEAIETADRAGVEPRLKPGWMGY